MLRLRVVEHAVRLLVEIVLGVLAHRLLLDKGPGAQRRVLLEWLHVPCLGRHGVRLLPMAHVYIRVGALVQQQLLAEARENVALVRGVQNIPCLLHLLLFLHFILLVVVKTCLELGAHASRGPVLDQAVALHREGRRELRLFVSIVPLHGLGESVVGLVVRWVAAGGCYWLLEILVENDEVVVLGNVFGEAVVLGEEVAELRGRAIVGELVGLDVLLLEHRLEQVAAVTAALH